MSRNNQASSVLKFLEEIRAIAQMGLNYSPDKYDQERYGRLLQLVSTEYSRLTNIKQHHIAAQFRKELGYITPKIGVDAAIFANNGKVLLLKRADDKQWCMPCGWAEVNETPHEAVIREVFEETGLKVKVGRLIDVFWRLPGEFKQPHTAYFLLYHCIKIGGTLKPTPEALEVGYHHPQQITRWHRDHLKRADRACKYWQDRLAPRKKADSRNT